MNDASVPTHLKLSQVIYSSASNDTSTENLKSILTISRENNKKNKVSGILLYCEGSFLQILEGEASTVESLFAAIQKDRRHSKIVKIAQRDIPWREFSEWEMGIVELTREELISLPGCREIFKSDELFESLDYGKARKIVEQFLDGYWRQRIR